MDIDVIGGCYREVCHWPANDVVLGSGGRAAKIIAQLSQKPTVRCHSTVTNELCTKILEQFTLLDIETLFVTHHTSPVFVYDHPLSRPLVSPSIDYFNRTAKPKINVTSENIVIFGMIEATFEVHGNRVVYDPQNTHDPLPFSQTGSTATELTLILNRAEARLFCGDTDNSKSVEQLASQIQSMEKASVVVIKCGNRGAFILCQDGYGHWISAYKTSKVYPIGSGDCFVAAFSYFWIEEQCHPNEAANLASKATAFYCETSVVPDAKTLQSYQHNFQAINASDISSKKIYLAGPFFSLKEMWLINQARTAFINFGVNVFSPYHDVGPGSADIVVSQDIEAIEECDILYALFDDHDPGTLFEIGYAIKANKPVVIYSETSNEEELKMYEGTGCHIVKDFSTSIYRTCWALNE